ncbi:hypothetical protein OSI46_25005, partial [Mycobacterium ulcerans]
MPVGAVAAGSAGAAGAAVADYATITARTTGGSVLSGSGRVRPSTAGAAVAAVTQVAGTAMVANLGTGAEGPS